MAWALRQHELSRPSWACTHMVFQIPVRNWWLGTCRPVTFIKYHLGSREIFFCHTHYGSLWADLKSVWQSKNHRGMSCVNWRNRWTLRSKTIGKDWQIWTRTQSHRLSLPCSPVELKRTTIINPSTWSQSWIRRAGWNVDVKVPPQSTN